MRYLFDVENTESARRRVWERMQAEGITRTILWNRVQPSYADWLQTVPPETTLLGLAYDPNRSEPGAFSGAGRAGEAAPSGRSLSPGHGQDYCDCHREQPPCIRPLSPGPLEAGRAGESSPSGRSLSPWHGQDYCDCHREHPPCVRPLSPGPLGAGRAGEAAPVPAALAGAFWIAPFGRCGTCHFVIFRDWRREAVPLGQAALRCIFAHWDFVSLLAGYPAPYRHVQHFIRALGFLPLGRLPEACAMPTPARPRRCRDMALALLSRTPEQTLSV